MDRERSAVTSSEEESGDDKENLEEGGGGAVPGPEYLKYEDFSHTPGGLETYNDGLQHPVEMRRILTGDLSSEMSVSYKESDEDTYRNLSYPKAGKRPAEVFESPSISVFSSSLLPKPPKLLKGSSGLSHSFSNQWLEAGQQSLTSAISDNISDFRGGHSSFIPTSVTPRKPGRPPTTSGSFDPETGSVRYLCRLQCGASLASAKGRRKHEKKHCPNFGKVEPPLLKGQQSQLQKQLALGLNNRQNNKMGFAHSLFGSMASKQNIQINPLKERRVYDCRYCGKVLKTYEGRRLHEKLQHVAKQQGLGDTSDSHNDNEIISSEDNKLLLIEHLKAAGMDPNILDDDPEKILGGEINPIIEYDNDEDDDDGDEDDDDIEAPSSDGIEQHN